VHSLSLSLLGLSVFVESINFDLNVLCVGLDSGDVRRCEQILVEPASIHAMACSKMQATGGKNCSSNTIQILRRN
jgi:hypothetical protein